MYNNFYCKIICLLNWYYGTIIQYSFNETATSWHRIKYNIKTMTVSCYRQNLKPILSQLSSAQLYQHFYVDLTSGDWQDGSVFAGQA